jgi:hypothetical protein
MNFSFSKRRPRIVCLGLAFVLGHLSVAESSIGAAHGPIPGQSDSAIKEFQDIVGNNELTAAQEASEHETASRVQTGYTLHSSPSAPAGTAAFMLQQPDRTKDYADSSGAQARKEIPYGEDKLVLIFDHQQRISGTLYLATGNVAITFRDMVIGCDKAEYDGKALRVKTHGKTRFRQDKVSLESSGAEFDFDTQSIILYDASGYFYDTIGRTDREFFLTGGMVQKIHADKLQIHWNTMKIVIP